MRNGAIFVIDPVGLTSEKCGCGENAGFVLGIHATVLNLCAECMAETAKRIVDGLK